MDSLAFMLWAARRYQDPEHRFILVVLVALIGLQEVGGHIERTQEQIGDEIGGYSRTHISWALAVLQDDGVVRRVRRGVYQLVPSGALRGGIKPLPEGQRRLPGSTPERVQQLDLLQEILADPKAPEAFKAMAEVDATLPAGPRQKRKGK
ncbi:hypothetical protein J7I97_24970 [Streptomyces sp. ISL-87]|uniref:hypothetical protein n=1 Tax=Streptomyces sp. ISL-87 TaxID=2819188 RepID=UPI001BE74477|nr:hypothetical protein [Streptomyces sp. ISL-87]MBT2611420.1 hypothetical protein [Streptomyces sp. ISL-87]